ncbi:MAG TPA: aldo/keto reductase [Candidatus Dormibacteraeota bacterium]|nr:aldo/keto reductase [Candidatus Dormibacteraeota bacterium]
MKQRHLGKSGLEVSLLGLGCNNFSRRTDLDQTREIVHKALDVGITLFDTADAYGGELGGSEIFLGQILKERRKDVILATKFRMPMDDAGKLQGASRRYIMTAVEASLRRLQTDWIDLYQLHRPDPATPIEETLRALDDLVRQGKVRYIGCTNLAAWQVVNAHWTSRQANIHSFISCQNEYNLLARQAERELVPAMEALGHGFMPYFPLASGMLTGKYRQNEPAPENSRLRSWAKPIERFTTQESNWPILENLRQFCAARQRSLVELAFGWLASRPFISSVIAGATSPRQVEENVKAIDGAWGPDDLAEIDRMTQRT